MDETMKSVQRFGRYIGCAVATGTAAWVVYRYLKPKKQRVCGLDYPKDKVIVHQMCMGYNAPSLGHFVVKLETYLRAANIPYEPNYTGIPGPRSKIPWIEYNGHTVSDSQLIIEFLNNEFHKDLDAHLSEEDRATAWAVQRWLEESTYWLSVCLRWDHYIDAMFELDTGFPKAFKRFVKKSVAKMTYVQGSGRFSVDELERMLSRDLDTLSTILGDKEYLMGGNKPTTFDCAVFGQLAQIKYQMPDCSPAASSFDSRTNLKDYIKRIKERYWPDWDERTTSGRARLGLPKMN